MKFILAVILYVTVFPVLATVYKCEKNNLALYQDSPCAEGSEIKEKLKLLPAPSIEIQKAARLKLDNYKIEQEKAKQLAQKKYDKERLIRIQADKANAINRSARASENQAYQQKRQADALEDRNRINRNRPIYINNLKK